MPGGRRAALLEAPCSDSWRADSPVFWLVLPLALLRLWWFSLWAKDRSRPSWPSLRSRRLRAAPGRRESGYTPFAFRLFNVSAALHLVRPSTEHLASYISALERGWSLGTRGPNSGQEELSRIAADPSGFLAEQADLDGKGHPSFYQTGPLCPGCPGMLGGYGMESSAAPSTSGGSQVPRPSLRTAWVTLVITLCPWKQDRGYAKRALSLLLLEVREVGLPFVEITTDVENAASQRVIEANGGRLLERFHGPRSTVPGPSGSGIESSSRRPVEVRRPGQTACTPRSHVAYPE